MFTEPTKYVGRFAPSPTGPLHFGSLVAAVASYCDAKSNQGGWLVRMEDLDKPREMVGAADDMLRTLDAFGFEWNDPVVYQSKRSDIYENYLSHLKHNGLVYRCDCSRKEIADSALSSGIDGAIYPRTCLHKTLIKTGTSEKYTPASLMDTASWRIHVDDAALITFKDTVQGNISQNLNRDIGDFILKRKDGLFAYQLAVVIDDALQEVTHIVRGADLLDSTPRQIYLQQLFTFATPRYTHVPVAVNQQNEKLSKQTLATAISPQAAPALMYQALHFLGQNPPAEMKHAALDEIWAWAIRNWQPQNIPQLKSQIYNY